MRDAVKLLARLEGLLFDPVYSGKGLHGLIDLVRAEDTSPTAENVVFLHTGGSAALFGYPRYLSACPVTSTNSQTSERKFYETTQ